MPDDDDFEAFLHIVHVSDMHCRDGGAPTDLDTERFIQGIAKIPRLVSSQWADFVEKQWEQGVAGHDPDAHDKMCDFLKLFANNPGFSGVDTWLLDTGDLSSMGDESSLRTAVSWLKEYQRILNATYLFFLYGNHDAWPGKFPLGFRLAELGSQRAELKTHRAKLRSGIFPSKWPQGPLSITIPYTQSKSKLLLNGVNSAIDDLWYNSRAQGEVGIDPNWASKKDGKDQLVKLAHDVARGFNPDGETRDFRILAVHHPVHYPPPRPAHTMSLRNDVEVANKLIRFDQRKRGKLAHLVLSGHTHETYPRLGALPRDTVGRSYKPLTDGQLQLIAGSLAQRPRDADRAAAFANDFVPHQFQILTFFASPRNAKRLLLIESRVAGRPGGTGNYKFLPLPDSSQPVETVRIEY